MSSKEKIPLIANSDETTDQWVSISKQIIAICTYCTLKCHSNIKILCFCIEERAEKIIIDN